MASELIGQFEVIGGRNTLGQFAAVDAALRREQTKATRNVMRQYKEVLQEVAPRSKTNGPHLADGFFTRVTEGNGTVDAEVKAGGPHAYLLPFIVDGTRPHIIRARNKPYLVFFWPRGPNGPGVYAYKYVNHPGTRPNDFPARAWGRIQGSAMAQMSQVAAQAIAGIRNSEL